MPAGGRRGEVYFQILQNENTDWFSLLKVCPGTPALPVRMTMVFTFLRLDPVRCRQDILFPFLATNNHLVYTA